MFSKTILATGLLVGMVLAGNLMKDSSQRESTIFNMSFYQLSQLTSELNVSHSVLNNLLKILKEKEVAAEEFDSKLWEVAANYKELLDRIDALHFSEDAKVAQLIVQAKTALQQWKLLQAEALFNQACDLDIAEMSPETSDRWRTVAAEFKAVNGNLMLTQLEYIKAGIYYQQAIALLPDPRGRQNADYLNKSGEAFFYVGDYATAKIFLLQALEIRKSILGEHHLEVVQSLNNLVKIYYHLGQYKQAEPLFQQIVHLRKELLGTQHPEVAESLNNLATLYYFQGNYEQAELLFWEALEIFRHVYGQQHVHVALGFNNLALLYESQNQFAKAQLFYQQSFDIVKDTLGVNHPLTQKIYKNYMDLLRVHKKVT